MYGYLKNPFSSFLHLNCIKISLIIIRLYLRCIYTKFKIIFNTIVGNHFNFKIISPATSETYHYMDVKPVDKSYCYTSSILDIIRRIKSHLFGKENSQSLHSTDF